MEKLKLKIMAAAAGHKADADIYIEENKRVETAANEGAIDKVVEADSFGIGIRLFKGSKMGFGFTTLKDESQAAAFVDKVASSIYIDGYDGYKPEAQFKQEPINLEDPDFDNITMAQRKKRALEIEAAVTAADARVKYARDTTCVDQKIRIHYLNTAGASYEYTKTYSYAFTTAIASDNGLDEAVDAMEGNTAWGRIDGAALGADAGKRAAAMLSGAPIASGGYNLIIPPYVACEFLQVISPMFSGANLRKGKTLLAGYKNGDMMGQEFLNIVDDARMENKAGSFPVDGEGVAGLAKHMIKNGKFNSFIYDKESAKHYGLESTGNGVRQAYKTLPEAGVSNFYMEPGKRNTGDILKKEKGIFVNSMMGLHMTDTVSGNFSLGMNGWIFEEGEKKQAVKEVLITGNIKSFLAGISAIGDDLKFYFNFGSPTIVVRGITLAGK